MAWKASFKAGRKPLLKIHIPQGGNKLHSYKEEHLTRLGGRADKEALVQMDERITGQILPHFHKQLVLMPRESEP